VTCIHQAQNKFSSSLLRTVLNRKVNRPSCVPDTKIKPTYSLPNTIYIFFIGPNSAVFDSKEYMFCLTDYMLVFGLRLFSER